MIEAVLSGITLGLVLAFLIGPVFFMLIDTSIKKGFRKAVFMAVGVMLSDGAFILITYFSRTAIVILSDYKTEIGVTGGVVLIIFGLVNFFKKPHISAAAIDLPDDSRSEWIDTMKGFMMNALNPFVLIFWIGVSGAISAKNNFTEPNIIVFYIVVLITVLTTDLIKAWLASRLKRLLKPGVLLWINRASGAGLMIFGIRMVYLILSGGQE